MYTVGAEVFFEPKSIAVVGASPRADNMGRVILNNLRHKFGGRLFVVNPKYDNVDGVKSYRSLSDIEEDVDVAVIAVNAMATPSVLDDAGRKGVKGVIIFSGGFAETGTEEGIRLQEEVVSVAKKYSIRVLGPNCIGVYNASNGVDTFFLPLERMRRPKPGPIAIVSQSGALLATLMDWAAANNIGISKAINFGNKVDIDEVDSLNYLVKSPDIKVILMYLEGVSRGRELVSAIRDVTYKARKPVLILKGGRTSEGSRATMSHTASIAGSYATFYEVMREANAIVLEDLQDMFDAAKVLSASGVPKGPRVAIITNSGGHGVIAADNIASRGLLVPPPSQATLGALKGLFPYRVSLKNPFDLTGDSRPEQIEAVAETLINNGDADAILLVALVQPPTMDFDKTLNSILNIRRRHPDVPMVVVTIGAEYGERLARALEDVGVPTFEFPDRAARALSTLWRCARCIGAEEPVDIIPHVSEGAKDAVEGIIRRALEERRVKLLEDEALDVLRAYGIPVAEYCKASDEVEVRECAARVGFPLAMKVVSPDIIHKSDVNGVVLNIKSDQEAVDAYRTIMDNVRRLAPGARVKGVLLQKMVTEGFEVIVGGIYDPLFGPIVTFGSGGLLVELISNISMRLAPVGLKGAASMMSETKAFRLLKGYRGLQGANIDSLAEVISRVSLLLYNHLSIKEVDINPVFARREQATAADARIVLGEVEEQLGER